MPVRSLSSSVLRWPDHHVVDRAVRRWAETVGTSHPEVARIGYFGSYARGDWGVGSDLDLIIIVDRVDQAFERRGAEWDVTGLPVPADVLVYTQQEFESLHPRGRFPSALRRETIWVYARP
jgi:predicted nucleotidyltransferase